MIEQDLLLQFIRCDDGHITGERRGGIDDVNSLFDERRDADVVCLKKCLEARFACALNLGKRRLACQKFGEQRQPVESCQTRATYS